MNHRPELLNNDFIFGYPSYLETNAPLNLPVGRLIGFDSDKNDVLKYYGSNECVYVDESSGFFYIKKSKNCNFDYDREYYIHTYLEFTPKVCDSQDIFNMHSTTFFNSLCLDEIDYSKNNFS